MVNNPLSWVGQSPYEQAQYWYQWAQLFANAYCLDDDNDLATKKNAIARNLAQAEREMPGFLGTVDHTPEMAQWVIIYRLEGGS